MHKFSISAFFEALKKESETALTIIPIMTPAGRVLSILVVAEELASAFVQEYHAAVLTQSAPAPAVSAQVAPAPVTRPNVAA